LKKKGRMDPERAFEGLVEFFGELGDLSEVVVVEGYRDVEALRKLGFKGNIEPFSQVGVSDADFIDSLISRFSSVVILTDFDEEGRKINLQLSRILERRGTRVEKGLRRRMGRIMSAINVYAIEALDNVLKDKEQKAL
jgi:5S rRNA maturation endonuclease (ribonuclease M5)